MKQRRQGKRSFAASALALRGAVLVYVALLVLIPVIALLFVGLEGGLGNVWKALSSPIAAASVLLTLWTSAVAAVVVTVMGTLTAWVLVRYRFPGRRLLSALVDLPLSIPTLVVGMAILAMLGPNTLLGASLEPMGFKVAFAHPGILLALAIVALPFPVRAVEPVLMELDPAEEEAAATLGATRATTVLRVLLPPLLPAILSGVMQAFSRCIAEFGSVVVVSGNISHKTLTAPVYLFGEVEAGRPAVAAAVAVALLAVALASTGLSRFLEHVALRRRD
ncbi:MAG: sulfate ABC transporter permease subunit [Myxococcota bacterium]|jgi:sulfate transport system permease protein|nr:sulfate ABC transporter permease subunit [Myxococcota bacterium]